MSTIVTLAAGPTWCVYFDSYYGRTWLEIENVREDAELEIERSVDRSRPVIVSVMLPEDLAERLSPAEKRGRS